MVHWADQTEGGRYLTKCGIDWTDGKYSAVEDNADRFAALVRGDSKHVCPECRKVMEKEGLPPILRPLNPDKYD